MKIIDLTQPLTNKTPVYPKSEDTPPKLLQTASFEHDGYRSYTLCTGMHVGTHIDSPAHMIANGKRIDQYHIERFCGNAILIDARNQNTIDRAFLKNINIPQNAIVLFCTGYDKYFFEDSERYFTKHPLFTEDAARWIVEHKISMVGFDMPSPDKFPFNIHKILFEHDLLIIENLTHLEKLIDIPSFYVCALPLNCATDGSPARVIAQVEDIQ